MKKLMFVLLLIVSIGFLAAATSEASATVGYVKYHIKPGINFIAAPMDAGYVKISELLIPYSPNGWEMDNYSIWDNSEVQNWSTTTNDGTNFFDPDFDCYPGVVIQFYYAGDTEFDLYSLGSLPAAPATYPIKPGLNTVMVPLNRSDIDKGSDIALEIGAGMVDNYSLWDNSAVQNWATTTNDGDDNFDPDFDLTIGDPIQLYYLGDTEIAWPTRNAAPASVPSVPTTSHKVKK